MANNMGSIDMMKIKLKSATKLKLQVDRELCSILMRERSVTEEIEITNAENELLNEQLQTVTGQIAQNKHQISMVEICSTSEKSKINAHVDVIEKHRMGYQDLFNKEHEIYEHQLKLIEDKKAADEEQIRVRKDKLDKQRAEQEREIAALEAECENVEKECAVLKKRNNAIMLQLRRKLLETENKRRELMKKTDKET